MGVGAGPEVFEQPAGIQIGAFEVSGFGAMGHDDSARPRSGPGRAPAPCDARPATSAAPAPRLRYQVP